MQKVLISKDGGQILSAGRDGQVLLWDVHRGCLVEALQVSTVAVVDLVWCEQGLVFPATLDGALKVIIGLCCCA